SGSSPGLADRAAWAYCIQYGELLDDRNLRTVVELFEQLQQQHALWVLRVDAGVVGLVDLDPSAQQSRDLDGQTADLLVGQPDLGAAHRFSEKLGKLHRTLQRALSI